VVHHALCGVIEPIFDRTFIFDNYACRTGKGTHAAVDRFTAFSRKYPFVLKTDVRKYFPSIDHDILKAKIRRKIKCADTLWLIDLVIDGSNPQEDAAAYFPGDDLFTPFQRRRGIPIGNLASQLFANLYLSAADHFIKARFPEFGYIRYMDDMVVFGRDKPSLWRVADELERFLQNDRLRLHERKRMVYPVGIGVNFLGYKIYPDHRRVRYQNAVRYRRRLKALKRKYERGEIDLDAVRRSVHSWIGHVRHADSVGLRRSMFREVFLRRGGA